jgi:hypothetical protein
LLVISDMSAIAEKRMPPRRRTRFSGESQDERSPITIEGRQAPVRPDQVLKRMGRQGDVCAPVLTTKAKLPAI